MFGPKLVTIIFTDTSIRIAKASPSSRGVKISYVAKKSLPPSTVFNGRIINENLFRESLKSLYLETFDQVKTKSLVLGLNEQESFITNLKFDKKPKDFKKNIQQYLIDKLPFDLSKAVIKYKEVSPGTFQIIAVKNETLSLLSKIFSDVGYNVKAIVPTPLVFPTIVGKKQFPYLVLSSGEDIGYTLVGKNTVVFSSTNKLKTKLNESDKEIIKIAGEIIEEEYGLTNPEQLRNVYIFGNNANILKGFFTTVGFNTQVIATISDSNKQASYDVSDFSQCIALSFYNDSTLSFQKFGPAVRDSAGLAPTKKPLKLRYFVVLILILTAAGFGYFFRTQISDLVFSKPGGSNDSTTQSSQSSSPKPKEASPNSQTESSPSAQPKKEQAVNKKNYKIRVLNGSGKVGAAADAKTLLESKGYLVTSTGNADHFNYTTSQIRVKKSKEIISGPLTKDLKQRYSISVGSVLSENEPYDVLITIGGS